MVFEIVSNITGYLKFLITFNLYGGAFLAALIETIFPPIPSEIVMPLAGYLASLSGYGYSGLLIVVLSATLGAVLGAIIIYYVSLKLGRIFILKCGKYFFVDEKKLSAAEKWFEKHGAKAVFFGRMAPGIRELISVPAGFSKMNFKKFLIYTFLGSFIWTAFLVSLGFFLGVYAESFNLSSILNKIAIVIILTIVCYIIFKYLVKKSSKKESA